MKPQKMKTGSTSFLTPLGMAVITGGSGRIKSLRFEDPEGKREQVTGEFREASKQVLEYFEGSRKEFDLDVDPEGTPFQKRIWTLLLDIPFGKTWSYYDLAKKAGDPRAIRAVAAANGQNPLWLLIPCHRVIGSDGKLTGYAGGIWRKKWLLDHEHGWRQQVLFS